MKNNITLPELIYKWIRDKFRTIDEAMFRMLLRRHCIYVDPSAVGKHVYWMNIVKCVGGRERQKPCEYIFENPWHARMHEEICKTCMTWEFVTTVIVVSPVELTTTNYQKMVDEDEEWAETIREMQRGNLSESIVDK